MRNLLENVGGKIINLKINKIKIFVFLTCILLVNINSVNSSTNEEIYDQNINPTSFETLVNVGIVDITDGIGLDIIIKNNGDSDVENLLLEIDTYDNTIILQKQYEISYLSADDSTNIHITLFGFNIGLIRDYSKIYLVIKDGASILIEGQIITSIFGPFVSIISRYFNNDGNDDGYILYCPMWSTTTYIINKEGEVVHTWKNSIYQDSQSTYLLENGNLVRASLVATSSFAAGGYQGRVEIFDWNDSRVWNYEYSTYDYCSHHDVQPLPNGNILLIAWEKLTQDELLNAGRNPDNIPGYYSWSDYIIEVQPVGDSDGVIVWEWHAWDHLIQ
ncbi:MAG: aryl-sulfate sulfotransferase, partial [Thermoplasmatales archaeon]|nr:aryl-sulfate sulfotransferase [Thermoplasmatales archaeon]